MLLSRALRGVIGSGPALEGGVSASLPPVRARLGQVGIWVVVHELSRRLVVDESLIEQPPDGPSPGSNIPLGVPRRDQRLRWLAWSSLMPSAADGQNPVEIDELDLVAIDPLPGYVWYQDMLGLPVSLVQNATSPVHGSISQRCS